jgi:hypothetical protein
MALKAKSTVRSDGKDGKMRELFRIRERYA